MPEPATGELADHDLEVRSGFQQLDKELWDRFFREGGDKGTGPVLFPPFPPALDTTPSALNGQSYPISMTEFCREPFFMSFGSLGLRHLIEPRFLNRIADYLRDRDRAANELHRALARQPGESPSAAITSLGQSQASRLRHLEEEALEFLVDLTTVGSARPYDTGAALRNARDAVKSDESPGMKEYCTALLAAQFHPGLSLEQRQFLQEIAADYLVPAETRSKQNANAPEYFLPAGAQVRWPAKLPAELSSKLAVFREKRAALKHELAEAVTAAEAGESESKRTKQYEELAAREAPAFAELETLAEEIRRLAAGVPYPDQPAPVAFPAALVEHMGAMLDHKSILVREVQRRAKDFGAELAPDRVEVAFQHNAAALTLLPVADSSAKPVRNRKEVLKRFEAENKEFSRRFEELAKEMNSVRTELQRYHDSLPVEQAPDLNALSAEVARAGVAHQNWERYRDYRDAVLTPGLLPAQRRLLFNAAVVELEKYRLSLVN
ncbi:MAG TPA: hypothetical protein VHD61_09995 [Lacunisphaera sp.]|nr:hypothetical protein [Lacunisphaera sp.]